MAEHLHHSLAILRRKQVEARTGLRRSTIYQKVAEGDQSEPVDTEAPGAASGADQAVASVGTVDRAKDGSRQDEG